ncbi:hypothetical protein V502_01340 [Pseudogymnoascus sp. VKM F-4520 (FW-2644)]|nr:hypothetical protein V502_01340 [Pseudogymnoascus sp. VKM F-4520 (FW-2644)]
MSPNIEGGQYQDPANSVFNTALKQSTSLRTDLATLSSNPLSAPASLTGQISASLTSFSRTLDSYADLAKHELNTQKAEKASERLTNFRHDLADYKSQFERVKKDREDATAQSNRSELLGRRPHHGGSSTPDNPYANAQINKNAQAHNPWAPGSVGGQQSMSMGSGETTREAHAMREQNFFGNTHSALDEYLARGQAVLGDLGQQREMLKGTQKRLYSVANTLGISGDTIRMVERRAKQDKWIFAAGVLIFFTFCFLVLKYLR